MTVKLVILVLFAFVFYALGSALVHLVRDPSQSKEVARALTRRLVVSILIFLLLFFAMWMGWVHPHGMGG